MKLKNLTVDGESGISAIIGVVDPADELKLSRTVYRISQGCAIF